MLLVQRLEGEAQARGRAGREVLHQHVGLLEQAIQDLRRARVLQIEREAFLGAVGPHEVRSQAAHALVVAAREVAHAGTLDLDDARAEVGELARAERRRDGVLERDDCDAFQWSRRHLC